jgi:hypothetical protein
MKPVLGLNESCGNFKTDLSDLFKRLAPTIQCLDQREEIGAEVEPLVDGISGVGRKGSVFRYFDVVLFCFGDQLVVLIRIALLDAREEVFPVVSHSFCCED